MRKTNLARLLVRRPDGIFAAPFEQGEIGPDLFRAACGMGLEGLVSKRRDRPYRGWPAGALDQDQEPQTPQNRKRSKALTLPTSRAFRLSEPQSQMTCAEPDSPRLFGDQLSQGICCCPLRPC